jgi:hypothetical protein
MDFFKRLFDKFIGYLKNIVRSVSPGTSSSREIIKKTRLQAKLPDKNGLLPDVTNPLKTSPKTITTKKSSVADLLQRGASNLTKGSEKNSSSKTAPLIDARMRSKVSILIQTLNKGGLLSKRRSSDEVDKRTSSVSMITPDSGVSRSSPLALESLPQVPSAKGITKPEPKAFNGLSQQCKNEIDKAAQDIGHHATLSTSATNSAFRATNKNDHGKPEGR